MASPSPEISDEREEAAELERRLWALTERKMKIVKKSPVADKELNRIWKEEKQIIGRTIETMRQKGIKQEKREVCSLCFQTIRTCDLQAELDAVTNENTQLKQQVEELSERGDRKYLKELQATLQSTMTFSKTLQDEMKRKDEIDKLKRQITRLEDKSAEQRIAYETQLRELDELKLSINEKMELIQTLSEVHRQQPAEQVHHPGRLIGFMLVVCKLL